MDREDGPEGKVGEGIEDCQEVECEADSDVSLSRVTSLGAKIVPLDRRTGAGSLLISACSEP